MCKQKKLIVAGVIFAAITLVLFVPVVSIAGSLEPPSGPPVSTMKTLDEIPPTWSQKLPCDSTTNCPRFEIVMDGAAVLDKETGLVWQKDVNATKVCWWEAMEYCSELTLGGRLGWRLPTIQELASLIDRTQTNPALPSGHPFTNVWLGLGYSGFWSATFRPISSDFSDYVRVMFLGDGLVSWEYKMNCYYRAWCARGGLGVGSQ